MKRRVFGISASILIAGCATSDLNSGLDVATALVGGFSQAALTSGSDSARVGAGLMALSQNMLNMNSNAGNYNSSSSYSDSSTYASNSYNTSADDSLGAAMTAGESGVTYCHGRPLPAGQTCDYGNSSGAAANTYSQLKPGCPLDFKHLSPNMPPFEDPMLSNIRQSIFDTSMAQIVSGAKQQGMSKDQTISMAMRQADEFENTARQNANAAAEVSTYLTPRAIVTGVNRGSLSLSLPCSGSPSMVEAAECAVIQQVWGAMANREIAKQLAPCW
ncbi:MAG: hypothetical protein ACR65O_10455 [Methylomicrobium sp.]|jgi:hypothetical protein